MLLVLSLTKCRLRFIIHYYKGSRHILISEAQQVFVVHGHHDTDNGFRKTLLL